MKKTLTLIAVMLLITGSTYAFFNFKSCEEGNSDKCFKEINTLKKQYDKQEDKAIRIQEYKDKLEEEKRLLQEKIDGVQSDIDFIHNNMNDISTKANDKRKVLQSLGF